MLTYFILGVMGFAAIGLISYLTLIYNSLVVVKNNVQKAWGNIDVLLKQRHDEIAKLIKICEGYMKYEKDALVKIISLRNTAAGAMGVAAKAAVEGRISTGLHQIFALAENYPDLKANGGFRQLQDRVSLIEAQIADRREFYNDSVNNYNIRIESIPDSAIANFLGLKALEMFQIRQDERKDVVIDIKVP